MYTRPLRRESSYGHWVTYPMEKKALNFVRDGNVMNIPYSVAEDKRFCDVYGPQVAGMRGRTTHTHPVHTGVEDSGSKMERTMQEVVADVIHIASEKFLINVSSLWN